MITVESVLFGRAARLDQLAYPEARLRHLL